MSNTSQIRHRPIHATAQTTPVTLRSNRPSRLLTGQQLSQRDQSLIESMTTRQYAQQWDTDEDEQIAPSTRTGRGRGQYKYNDTRYVRAEDNPYYEPYPSFQPKPNHNLRLWVGVVGGMCAALLLLVLSLHALAWYMDTFHDPSFYTQANHRDVVTVRDAKGNQEQIRAFVDADGYLDEIIVPKSGDGPLGKVKIVRGPKLDFDDPQKALIQVSDSNGTVTAYADGPREVGFLGNTGRDHSQWTTDYAGNAPTTGEAK